MDPAVRAGADLDRPLRDVSVTPHGITQVGTVTRQANAAQQVPVRRVDVAVQVVVG